MCPIAPCQALPVTTVVFVGLTPIHRYCSRFSFWLKPLPPLPQPFFVGSLHDYSSVIPLNQPGLHDCSSPLFGEKHVTSHQKDRNDLKSGSHNSDKCKRSQTDVFGSTKEKTVLFRKVFGEPSPPVSLLHNAATQCKTDGGG